MREKTFETFYPENDLEQLPPLERAQVKGWVSSVFWGLEFTFSSCLFSSSSAFHAATSNDERSKGERV